MNDNSLLLLFPTELIHHICSFFDNYIIYHHFRLVCQFFYRNAPSSNIFFRVLFAKRIQKDTNGLIDGFEFCQALEITQSIVAGSYPLQVLLGEHYHSDIDIYTQTVKRHGKFKGHYKIETWVKEQLNITISDENSINNFRSNPDEYDSDELLLCYTNTVSLKRLCNTQEISDINIIGIREEILPAEYIFEVFDFSFVKIMFDGNQFYTKDLKDILEKKGHLCKTVKNTKDLNSIIKRYHKYKNRHFQFDSNEMTTMKNIRDNITLAGLLEEEMNNNTFGLYISTPRLKYLISQVLPDFYQRCPKCNRMFHNTCKCS